MISAAGSRNTPLDLQHHLQAASRAFHGNKWILCDKGVSVLHRLRYFEKVISPVACFGASHRAIHKDDLAKLDVEYRRLMRMIVGPPAGTSPPSTVSNPHRPPRRIRVDNRRIEVIANGLPLWGGRQMAIDTSIVAPLTSQAAPRQHRGQYAGTALRDGQKSKERTYPELVQPRRCRLVVFGIETGGRRSEETAGFVRHLAKARARQSPEPLRQAVTAALIARWSAILAHATFTALAASLLCEDTSSHNSVDGCVPPCSACISHMPREPTTPQPKPSPLLKSMAWIWPPLPSPLHGN